ncbi:fumarylacetoacetate hydrolase family protein [Caballeronia sp. SEWSISQ10-4 2]|uniref:fumarylacetoacetate hydrolase family protein n=1 Tax=Caballeronia sp. SEWSISQ10-4 2 TaxID=2937438 RepID=UPI0026548E22|nr:fumarylacetoacetate hydrolase family protein [Caballeronia sp. SEWSISQ10-4 2]MDN7177071.1 fumarylacetoacetate hydrolase family protein [Caballeronia sp. SEWSISQ10-4 2]
MKIARYLHANRIGFGIVDNDRIVAITPSKQSPAATDPVTALLAALASQALPETAGWGRTGEPTLPIEQVRLLAPVERPGKIIGVGRNYVDHASEMAVETPDVPKIFFKWPGSVIGHRDEIRHTPAIRQLDYEVEIAVVIGKAARNVPRSEAARHIAGLTIVNDVSERSIQMMPKSGSTSLAKSLDTFCPMGPWLVTLDEVGSLDNIVLECRVNDELVQRGHSGQMIFPIPVLIEYLSQYITLEPGDVIATGTPAGVAMFRDPPLWLKPGDRIRMDVAGIGTLQNRVVAA